MKAERSMRSALGKVRGLGSARHGTESWVILRLTAIALVPLTLWFVATLAWFINTADHQAVVAWIKEPISAALIIILIVAGFIHAIGGMKEVIEDYVHAQMLKTASLLAVKLGGVLFAVVGVLSVLKILFGMP